MHRHRHTARNGAAYLFLVWPLRLMVWVLVFAGCVLCSLLLWAGRQLKRLLSRYW